jgi:prevent-host-death family protein
MKIATFSELRNNAKRYFDEVEKGESIQIYRHGKPVAMLVPIKSSSSQRWKRVTPLHIPGVSLSAAILAEREEER